MLRIVLLLIAAWLLYKFIFELVIPIYRSTKMMRSKFKEMQEQMRNGAGQSTPPNNTPSDKPKSPNREDEYIEFEEV